jgi:hypothetical protein
MLTRILILAVVFQISLGVGAGFTAEKAKKDVQTQAPIPAKSAEAKPSAIPVNSPPPPAASSNVSDYSFRYEPPKSSACLSRP